jgi:hypothetical protein
MPLNGTKKSATEGIQERDISDEYHKADARPFARIARSYNQFGRCSPGVISGMAGTAGATALRTSGQTSFRVLPSTKLKLVLSLRNVRLRTI